MRTNIVSTRIEGDCTRSVREWRDCST